jgi:periplasmic protein TonB
MTLTGWHRSSDNVSNNTAGWVVSVLLHGSVVVGALLFVQRVQLAPQTEPFKWNVAIVSSVSQPTPSPASSALASSSPQANPTTPPTISRMQPASPVTEPTKSEPVQPKPPVTTATALPTPPPRDEPHQMKPVEPVPPTPVSAPVSPPLPVEPIDHRPTPVESASSSRQSAYSETSPILPLRESDPTVGVTPSHPEPPTPTSSIATSSSEEPAPSITPPVTTLPSDTSVPAASSATQIAALAPPGSNRPVRADYGWLSEAILRRVEELKRYPAEARVDRAEGKVVVKAVINEDGSVDNVEIFQSSGSTTLDKAAVDLMQRAGPFSLPHSLGKPRVTVKIPMNYRLDR